MEMTITESGPGTAVLKPVGRLNMASAPHFKEGIRVALGRGFTRIVVDLSEIDFMDSSGLGAIINGLKSAREQGGELRLAAVSWQAGLVLKLTNMDQVLSVHEDARTAFADV
ncbi:STAS domain-containing protein [Pseudolysinimonas yzui]|uniref:Anti-sigma factor antagonist n=1 Tax=Pseudolysinimonas yzui TaxID=2708254 RepID=A0A8J3M2W8_9MICO|nr:STAS domain-containing protein [Pseudolysinimonas yzui]GHF20247.1 anti-sigma factor antagonist [Pseudolysinimonas yzui]